jgi:ribosomal RNA-processing protein 17
MPPPTKRRKTNTNAVEEIVFDSSARQEYLTGFHKRKLQRAKHAQELAEKKAREERIEERRKVCILFSGAEIDG